MALVLDGRIASEALRLKVLSQYPGHKASLAILQVGSDPRSGSYVKNKLKTAEKWGIKVQHVDLPRTSSFNDIQNEIIRMNNDPTINGYIFQLPPDVETPLSADQIHLLLESIDPLKDADGLLSANLGSLLACGEKGGTPIPATPLGVLRLLEHFQIPIEGKDVCVLGKSRLVGMPLAVLLEHRGATVTLCHSQTKNSAQKAKSADIVVAATGVKALVNENYIHENSVLIDVGIVSTPEGIRGDIDHSVYQKVSAYSPVPGGVGPMTVAALMENTIQLWFSQNNKKA